MKQNEGLYQNLLAQAESILRHIRAGSYETKRRYFAAYKRFLTFLAEEFHLQKISNIDTKHLVAYTQELVSRGISIRTIKTDLSAIRFFHDHIPYARHALPDNDQLGIALAKRTFSDEDRSWTYDEFSRMCLIAEHEGHEEYARAMSIAYYCGLRIHEIFRLDVATVRRSIRDGQLHVKGKGGKNRKVPLCAEAISSLSEQLSLTAPGKKLFVPADTRTDLAMAALRVFLRRYREDFRVSSNPVPLTFHGLRHSYAAEQYRQFRRAGHDRLDACLRVSLLLGHERGEITCRYLSSVDEDEF